MESLALQDCLKSGIDPDIIRLNFKDISGLDLFEAINPNPKRLNAGRLNASEQRLFNKCVDWDGFTPVSFAWDCNGRIRVLFGPLLDPDHRGKVNKYRNAKGSKAPITFLKVPLQIWQKIAARYGVAMPENITITNDGEALGFWTWVFENQVPILLTEGEKKAGCLLTLGYAAVSIPGISMGWRVTDRDFKGKAIARELHPDLLPLDDGREITIAFDYRPGDYFKSPEWVNAAILGRLFKNSTVKIARLPGPQKGIDDFAVAGGDVTQVITAAETLKQLQDERLWRSFKGFTPDKVVNQRYLDIEAPEHGKITAIKSGLGTGKTQYLADKVAPLPGKQINIGYRNSLLLQMAQKLGSYHLDEHKGHQMMNDPEARISLCWDSLQKVTGITFEGAGLILDEFASSLKHLLTSSTCRDNRLDILDHLKAIAPSVDWVVVSDGNLKDSDVQYLGKIFPHLSVSKIENQFKGDTPPVTFLELPKGRYRIGKEEFEYLSRAILQDRCPAITADSLKDAEALNKQLTAQGKKGILLTSKTATKKWAKEFLANPDAYIRKHKPQFIIFSPTAESGLDIAIKENIDNLELDAENYFSSVFCIFRGVIGVDECLQMSRRVRHPERIVICCAERKFSGKDDSNPFSIQLIKAVEERVNVEALALSPEENSAAIKEAIKAQIDSPHLEQWAKIKSKDAVEGRNLRRFLFKSYEDGGYEIEQFSFAALLDAQFSLHDVLSFEEAKEEVKKEEAKQIFDSILIDLEECQRIEKDFNSQWEDRAKAIKFRLMARLPGIENTSLWNWEFVYRVRFSDRDLLNQLEAQWKLDNPVDAELLQRQRWNGDFKTFVPDLSDRWLKLKVLDKLGINKFLDPAAVWTNESPEVLALYKQGKNKSVAALLGHPGKSTPIKYLNRLLKITGVTLTGSQVRDGDKRVWQYRFLGAASRPKNWDELYSFTSQRMTKKVDAAIEAENQTVYSSEPVTPPPERDINTAEAVTENQTNPIEKVWGVTRELAHIAARVAEGATEMAKACLQQAIKRLGIEIIFDAIDLLPEHERLAIEGLG